MVRTVGMPLPFPVCCIAVFGFGKADVGRARSARKAVVVVRYSSVTGSGSFGQLEAS